MSGLYHFSSYGVTSGVEKLLSLVPSRFGTICFLHNLSLGTWSFHITACARASWLLHDSGLYYFLTYRFLKSSLGVTAYSTHLAAGAIAWVFVKY